MSEVESSDAVAQPFSLRQSIAPKVLDNSLPMSTLVSTIHFSVRVADTNAAPCSSSSNVITTFIWRDPGVSVFVAGSFDDWRKHQMMHVPDVNYHILVTELPPGDYFYRFVVDGRWRVAEGDPNLKEDEFRQLSHFISINPESVAAATPKRFSTAAVAHADLPAEDAVLDHGDSDTESEKSFSEVDEAPLPPNEKQEQYESVRISRKRGDSTYIGDYDDDQYAGLDLQADVFEAMKDVAEVNSSPKPCETNPSPSRTTFQDSTPRRRIRQRPGVRMLRKVWGMLFGEQTPDENKSPNTTEETPIVNAPTQNQKVHGIVTHENALKKGLKVWFPNERNFPTKHSKGRKIAPSETRDVLDAGDRALKLHQVEENANNRQMLGKNLFAQGKYDAALALFSLSVKLREDNGLKYAKTTAIAHTDVASAFIHLEDLKNAEKHLNMALAIFNKGTFSGGKAQLGDVHCFLGVVGDMRGDLKSGEIAYRAALELYEKCKATTDNPNYATAIENLNANLRRQRALGSARVQATATNAQKRAQAPISPKESESSRSEKKPANHVQPQQTIQVPVKAPVKQEKSRPAAKPLAPSKPPKPLQISRPSPKPLQVSRPPPSPAVNHASNTHLETENQHDVKPDTWRGLAETARASMPKAPPKEDEIDNTGDDEPPAGSYEEMCRMWHKDARNLLGQSKYKEATDLYTLAVYTRKRHGPWSTRCNVDMLVEFARALFAMRDLDQASTTLKDAIDILEKISQPDKDAYLGELWGNLGSVLDRMADHQDEALSAHCSGMVSYGKSGMSSEDPKWKKAWKGLCIHLKMTQRMDKAEDIWHSIDLQIRGVAPMSKAANVIIR